MAWMKLFILRTGCSLHVTLLRISRAQIFCKRGRTFSRTRSRTCKQPRFWRRHARPTTPHAGPYGSAGRTDAAEAKAIEAGGTDRCRESQGIGERPGDLPQRRGQENKEKFLPIPDRPPPSHRRHYSLDDVISHVTTFVIHAGATAKKSRAEVADTG
ncbi:hypothetical protein BDZ97DRAFT_366118 [Flammula alnicola]|nr:hypothetical protein BDZ97DRAFT_366118 [Flammula alnicola]